MNKTRTVSVLLAYVLLLAACRDKDNPPVVNPTYTVGGSVSGLTASGLALQVNGGNNITVPSGATSFASSSSFATGTAFTVTVSAQPATQTCTVTGGSGSGTVASTNVTSVAINCVTNTFSVSATVTGLSGSGLVLQLNGGTGLSVTAGSGGLQMFSNRVNAGTAYAVTVQTQPSNPTQQCTVTNGSGAAISADVTNVTVACANVTTISGTAAVGAPLAGTVSVKDAAGTIRVAQIGVNGSYSIDVNGMTPPFVVRAEGTANGNTYIVHSAAVAADVGGAINVTQLTDLVVDNVAGQIAKTYFDNGDFASLTPTALNAEVAKLKERLLPVLTALGVEAGIDLLRSRFTPVSSALDHALDILRVSVNPANSIATITNIVTQQQIQDSIIVPAASEPSPPVMTDTGGVGTALADADAVKAALDRVAARFAAGLPSSAMLMADMTNDFLSHDMDKTAFIAQFLSAPYMVGSRFTDVDLEYLDHSDTPRVTASVSFSIKNQNGVEFSRLHSFKVRKDTDGVWRLHGTQQVLIAEGSVTLYKQLASGCISSGFEFHVIDVNPDNNGAVINHVNVYGPGLPGGFIRYNPPASGGGFWDAATSENLTSSCRPPGVPQPVSDTVIASIPDNSVYYYIAFTSADNSMRYNFPSGALASPGTPVNGAYWKSFPRRPHTSVEAVTSTAFATITAPASQAALAAYTSGPLLISASNVNPNFGVDLTFSRDTLVGGSVDIDEWVTPTAAGTMSTTLSFPAIVPGDVITRRSVNVRTSDAYRRTIMAQLHSDTP